MMTRLWLLLSALSLLTGCWSVTGLDRGTTITYDELYAARARLDKLVVDEVAKGNDGRAFYALEAHKSLRFAALTIEDRRSAPPLELGEMITLVPPQDEGSKTRGLKLVGGGTGMKLKSAAALDDEAFWKEQKEIDDRLEVMKGSVMPYDLVLAGRFVLVTAEELGRALSPEQVVISYLVTNDGAWGFVVHRYGMRALKLPATAEELAGRAAAMVGAVRDPTDKDWRGTAQGLYAALLAPFEAELGTATAVTIVPDGFLSNVPFAALLDGGGRMLLERARVGYLPSASFYRALLGRPLYTQPPRMLTIGNAAYPRPWQPLPAAESEARALERVFEGSLLLVGKNATEERFYDAHRSFNIYHLATHGMLTGTIAGRASSLVLTPSERADGYLSASEISALDLSNSYLTVLSACETAASGDAQSSLDSIAASFLSAGAPTVIGSQWAVSDESTAQLMMRFYERFLEIGPAAALRKAQLGLSEQGDYRHPFFWAAFVLYGWDK